jgi:hypothetical protein
MEENKSNKIYKLNTKIWYLERIIYLIAGLFVLGGCLLTIFVNPKFIYFAIFVSLVLIVFATTGYCPMAIVLGKTKIEKKLEE